MNIPDRWNPRLWLRIPINWKRRCVGWIMRSTPTEEDAFRQHCRRKRDEYLAVLPPHLREIVLNANLKSRQARQRHKENQCQARHRSSRTASSEDNPPPSAGEDSPQIP